MFRFETDYCNYNASGVVLHVGGNYNQNPNHGLFYLNGNNAATNKNANIGSRHHCRRAWLPVKLGAVVAERLLKISCDRAQAGTPERAKEGLRGYNGEPCMKRTGHLFEVLISDENINKAIDEVNRTHRWEPKHKANRVVLWVEATKPERVRELRKLIIEGFEPSPMTEKRRWDKAAGKWRNIHEPKLYPDQYVHHILVQALQPSMMRGMDIYACGSIRGRGIHYGVKRLKRWMKEDPKGTKYCAELDIHHFYDSLKPEVVIDRLKHLIKDRRVLDLCYRIIKDGVTIGAYTSQWFANTTLQPLDMMIHDKKYRVSHYLRYMDNFTIFSPNKKKLRRLKDDIESWLKAHKMELKENWQIFPTKSRLPTALGYRFGRGYTILRKRNLFRLKRQMRSYRRKTKAHRHIPYSLAFGLLSRLGQMKHCNSMHIYSRYVGKGVQKRLKSVVRHYMRKERKRWSTSTEQTATNKS